MKRVILDAYRLRSHRWECIVSFLGTENVKLGRWRTVGSTNALENHVIKGTWAERKAQPEVIRKLWPNRCSSAQFSSVAQSCPTFVTPSTAAHQASLSITNSQNLLKLMSIELVMPSNYLTFCYPLLPLPSIFPSIRVFSKESVLHNKWPKYWSFSFNISPFNEYSGLISFGMDWLDLLIVQWTLKSL